MKQTAKGMDAAFHRTAANCKRLFEALKAAGFDEQQAFTLLGHLLSATRGRSEDGPSSGAYL